MRRLRGGTVLVGTVIAAVLLSAPAHAAPGDLDPTFSGDGKQRTEFALATSRAKAIARQPDGKLVVIADLDNQPGLARYNPNGSLDTSFSENGMRTVSCDCYPLQLNAAAIQSDGKIVVVGSSGTSRGGSDFVIARFNRNGSLDSSFGPDWEPGIVRDDIGGWDLGLSVDDANGVAIQPDGKIVAVGSASDETQGGQFGVARYNVDGSPDTTFSGDGHQITDLGGYDRATGVVIQADGKIVAVGEKGTTDSDFAVVRYTSNGSLDTSFSGDGKQTTDFGFGAADSATGVAIGGGGKLVVVGAAGGGASGRDFALARYSPNGSLDAGFSEDGKRRTDFGFGANDEARGVAIQADGRIDVVGGASGGPTADDFALARYNPNGSLDSSFSGDGKLRTNFRVTDSANGVALQADGKIVAAGVAQDADGLDTDVALARYSPNGMLDASLSGDGKQTTSFASPEWALDVAIQGDGRIVAVGSAGYCRFALTRYNSNGSLDPSFSGDGKQTTSFDGCVSAVGVAIQTDGKIVVVGGDSYKFVLARYNSNGSLDPSFSGDGKQTTTFGAECCADARDVAIQGDGKIVVAGDANSEFAVARYNPNGSLDTNFSGDGKRTDSFAGGCCSNGASGVAIQANGRIVTAGGASGRFGLASYNPNGSLDASFSGDGKQTTDFGGGCCGGGATDVAIQGNGRIVTVGNGAGNFGLARYNPNGSLDTSFSGDGKQTTDFGDYEGASGVGIQSSGKIVAVGSKGSGDFALARYNPNGSLDASFSGDGRQTTDFGGAGCCGNLGAAGVAIQANSRIVVAGGAVGGSDESSDFALARYLGS